MACHGFAGAHLWDHHPIESGLQDFRRPFTLSHSPLPLNYARQRDRTGRLLILILIVILLGLGSWRLRVRLRLRLGRNHSALIQWQWGQGEGSSEILQTGLDRMVVTRRNERRASAQHLTDGIHFFLHGQICGMCQNTARPSMTFASRTEAGQRLGQYLAELNVQANLVLGLPRGGVIVAAEVARILKCPLDVLVVRKIGHPGHREFAVGALAEDGTLVLDEEVIARTGVSQADLREVLAEETERLTEYRARFLRSNRPPLKGKSALIVDDGLATGATTEAAVRSAKNRGAASVIVAAPVASDNAA